MNARKWIAMTATSIAVVIAGGCATTPQPPVAVEAVVGNNFGHLPMFVGVEKGLFKKHGIDLKLKVVDTGTAMVNSMTKREVQIGDMSVTTFLKARHAGSPFLVVGMIMNDATTTFADSPLAIVARKGSGITRVEDLKGKRIGLAKEQTSDEYLKMVLARRGMNYGEMNIQNIMAPPALVGAFAAGKIDAMVSWEPFNTMGLMSAPESYEVLRGGGHLSYMMIATVHDPMVQDNPKLIQAFVNGLAAASHYTRQNRAEAVTIFAKWVPNVNLDVGRKAIQHINFDPRISRESLRAFENAQNELLQLTIKGAKPLKITDVVLTTYTEAAQKVYPEYFADLPPAR
jgi:NitT/TauT family transport system substrate-binding protein/sulfonate transport system substrate-binding protein